MNCSGLSLMFTNTYPVAMRLRTANSCIRHLTTPAVNQLLRRKGNQNKWYVKLSTIIHLQQLVPSRFGPRHLLHQRLLHAPLSDLSQKPTRVHY
jgi:hypothetical protein